MEAIIRDGSQQFTVQVGSVIEIERVGLEPGAKYPFDVLSITDPKKKKTQVGTPLVKGAKAEGEVLEEYKGKKLIVYTFKRRKDYARKKGHRQRKTRVKITKLTG